MIFHFVRWYWKLKNWISKIKPSRGGDIPEDWVEGYETKLNKMNWKNWIKLTIYIVDTDHRKGFSGNDKC